jgi:hypothetical protein
MSRRVGEAKMNHGTNPRTFERALVLGILAVAGCGTPSPEKLCARVAEVSGRPAARACVDDLTKEQARDPAAFKTRAACVSAANDPAAMDRCFEDQARAAFAVQQQKTSDIKAMKECMDGKLREGLSPAAIRAACEPQQKDGGPACTCQAGDPLCSCL